MNKFTKQEKAVIDEQNEIVQKLMTEKFKETPFSICRDFQNRVIGVFGSADQSVIYAKMLGVNKSKKPQLKQVGTLSYGFADEHTLNINNLYIDKNLEGSGIDHIMVQSLQNFAAENGITTINASYFPSQTMVEGFSTDPEPYSEIQIDPQLITFFCNNFHQVFPFGKSYIKHNPFTDAKYYLQNNTIRPVDTAHGVSPQTKTSKIQKTFRPYKVQLEVAEKFYMGDPSFTPLSIHPSSAGTKTLTSLLKEPPKTEFGWQ